MQRPPEFEMFLLMAGALQEIGFAPFMAEVCLFHVGLCCTGQLGALLRNDKGHLSLIDWKRCRNVMFDNNFRTLLPPLEHLLECNGCLYMLQP